MAIGTSGKHIILDLWGVKPRFLRSRDFVRKALLNAQQCSGATLIGKKFHKFTPEGISGYVLIAESHISIHTWPADGYASIDIYTCGDKTFPQRAADELIKSFTPSGYDIVSMERGNSTSKKLKISR